MSGPNDHFWRRPRGQSDAEMGKADTGELAQASSNGRVTWPETTAQDPSPWASSDTRAMDAASANGSAPQHGVADRDAPTAADQTSPHQPTRQDDPTSQYEPAARNPDVIHWTGHQADRVEQESSPAHADAPPLSPAHADAPPPPPAHADAPPPPPAHADAPPPAPAHADAPPPATGPTSRVEPDARAQTLGFRERGRLRRRVLYLRRLRVVQLRDLGGFVLELHRFGISRADLVAVKVAEAAATDDELRALESVLSEERPLREIREAGIGGMCGQCGAVHGSVDRFCAACGTRLATHVSASSGSVGSSPPDQRHPAR